MSAPQFTIIDTPRGKLVMCEIDGETGAARVFSAGEAEAKQRAEEQARGKLAEKNAVD